MTDRIGGYHIGFKGRKPSGLEKDEAGEIRSTRMTGSLMPQVAGGRGPAPGRAPGRGRRCPS